MPTPADPVAPKIDSAPPTAEAPQDAPPAEPLAPPTPLGEEAIQEKIASLGIDSPQEKPKYTKIILIALAVISFVASVPLTIYLVRQRQEIRKEAIQDQFQCVAGCDGRVCEAQDTGYTWCSQDTRCVCTGPGQATAHADQYWCEGQNTMYCGEITAGNCGTKVDSQDRKSCGGAQAECDHYTDCFNKVQCEWPASTYCVSGQCTCADVAQQREHGEPLGWVVCEDTEPRCTPGTCPAGWQDCGLNYARTDYSSACVKSVMCGPAACGGCENTYVVWRYCKPAGPTATPTRSTGTPTPTATGTVSLTPTATVTVTPTATITPTATRIPMVTPTGTVRPTSTVTVTPTSTAAPTATPTPTPTAGVISTPTPTTAVVTLAVEQQQPGFTLPTLGALLGGVALIIASLLLFL